MKKFTIGVFCALLICLSGSLYAQNVWTQHNDLARTGWYPYETTLNTTNVNQSNFGLLFNQITDDKVVAQPLIVMNVNIQGVGVKNIVYVATLNNTVYAYDADANVAPYWQQNFTNKNPNCTTCRPAFFTDIHPSLCYTIYPDFNGNMGIIGTPVIDTLNGIMYFITKIVNPKDGPIDNHTFKPGVYDEYNYTTTGFHQYLHAIDIKTGVDKSYSPVEITATANGAGDGQNPAGSGHITFEPRRQFDRAGLVLYNGILYIAFAAHCDFNPSHGWVLSYNASNLTPLHAFIATPNDGRGGSWMSGTAPALDTATGNLYISTGNSLNEDPGTFSGEVHNYPSVSPSDPLNRGESVIKLNSDLTLADYFTPFTYLSLNDNDKDFPIQILLLPKTNLALAGCKDDSLYILNRSNLGGFNPVKNNVVQTVNVKDPSQPQQAEMHASFAYFGGPTAYAYQFSENTPLRAYAVSSSGLGPAITNTTIAGPTGGTGGFLSVSSNGNDPTTGILWAYQAINGCDANSTTCHGILHAVNASDITKELWNSQMNATTDQINWFNKMSCPTIARGKVYIASNINQLSVYGLKTSMGPCPGTSGITASTGSYTTVFTTQTPTSMGGQDNPATGVELGVQFQSSISGNIIGVRFYKTAGYSGTHIGNLYSAGGTMLAQATFTGETASGWQTVYFSPAVGITAGTTYVAAFFDASDYYVSDDNGLTAAISNPPLTALAGGGVYNYSNGPIFPTLHFMSSNYWVDPIFSPTATPDPGAEHINWNTVGGASQYIINYRPELSQSWITRTSSSNFINLSSLSCGTLYYFSIQTVCGSTQGSSSSGSFTTGDCPVNSCDSLPAAYYNVDLGDIGLAGSTCLNGTVYTLTGSGTDIGGSSDQFQFAFTSQDISDYAVSGKIISQDQVSANDKLGIMVRDSMTNTSRFAYMASVNNGAKFIFEYRSIAGGGVTTVTANGPFTFPYWMKITKSITSYAAYYSKDSVNWTQVGTTQNLNFGTDPTNPPHYGMAITSANNSVLSTGKIGSFTLTSSTALPIRLMSFTAKDVNQNYVLVSWATSMEHLTDHYEVERSGNNSGFQTIGQVPAVGESEIPQYYSIKDNDPLPGVNFYRLKEVDKDAKFYYSPVVSVNFGDISDLEMYPNPTENYTNIRSLRDPILEVSVFDVTGKMVQNMHLSSGQNSVRLNLSNLSKAIYFIKIKTTTATYRQKLFRQ
jgi:hypothetical protein